MTYSFLGSGVLHAALTVAILMMNVMKEVPKFETVEIQIQDHRLAMTPIPTQTEEVKPAQVPEPAPKLVVPEKPRQTPAVQAVKSSAPVAQTDEAAVDPAFEAQDFEASLSAPVEAEAPAFDESTIADDIERVDGETAASLQAQASSLKEVDSVIDESEVLASQAKQSEKERAASMAKIAAARRAQEHAQLEKMREANAKAMAEARAKMKAEALAKSRAEAEARAQQLADAEARYQKSKAAAIAAAQETAEQIRAQQEAAAQGPSAKGDIQGGNAVAGASQMGQIRSLEELKQMPGNKRPQYDSEDRLARRMGDVVFLAFISKEGTPMSFKMIRSSGHRTLDYKTLKAIREWKFYPGQEGWVEIPFRWDLKGDPRPIGGTLRKVSQK
jgi:TolA protein